MYSKIFVSLVVFSLLFAGCISSTEQPVENVSEEMENETEPQQPQEAEESESELANPAAVNCVDQGYDYEIRDTAAGQVGYCIYEGEECEEWALYNEECCLRESDCSIECDGTVECVNNECVCTEEEETQYETTDKTISEIMDEYLASCNSIFYSENPSGNFVVKTFNWAGGETDNPPGVIPIGAGGMQNDIFFNNEPIDSVVAVSFRVYESDAEDDTSCGAVMFKAESTVLENYDDFSILFQPSFAEAEVEKDMSGCEKLEKVNFISDGEVMSVYSFRCNLVE